MRYPLTYYLVFIPLAAFGLLLAITWFMNTTSDPSPGQYLVCGVEADQNTPGRAYVQLQQYYCRSDNLDGRIVYATDDYGQHWYRTSERGEAQIFERKNIAQLSQDYFSDALYYNSEPVWSFPRRGFRQFFWELSNFFPSYHYLSSDRAHGISYVALGEYGVLVGPYPPDSTTRPWLLYNDAIPELDHRVFTIRNPFHLLVIALLGLAVPPLPFIHTWLLTQVWRYAVPDDEAEAARRAAWRVSVQLSVLALAAILIWLTNMSVDFYDIVIGMSLITVSLSVATAVQIGRAGGFSNNFTLRLAAATGLVSLVVPVGVATTPYGFGWFVIIGLLLGFIIYRRTLVVEMGINATQGQTDRLTLEITGGMAVILCVLSGISITQIVALVGGLLYVLVRLGLVEMQQASAEKSKAVAASSAPYGALLGSSDWWVMWFLMTLGWVFSTLAVGGMIFVTQLLAYGYFSGIGNGYY